MAGSNRATRRFGDGDVHGGGDHVVARLPSIHVIVRVGAGEMADYLIGVHVRGSAAAGLEDVDREFIVVSPFHDLFCRGFDSCRQSRRQVTHAAVHVRGSAFDHSQRADKRAWEALSADREVLDRSRCLRPIECRGGHLHVPHSVAFDSERVPHDSIVRPCRSFAGARAALPIAEELPWRTAITDVRGRMTNRFEVIPPR